MIGFPPSPLLLLAIVSKSGAKAKFTVQAGEDNFGWQFRCTATAEGLTADSKIVTLKKK